MKRVYLVSLVVILGLLALVLMWPKKHEPRGFAGEKSAWQEPFIVDSVISRAECKRLIDISEPKFSRSELVGIPGGDSTRTSETAWVSKNDPIARKILKRACEITGKQMCNCEDLQVVKYTPGTYYKAHHDSCCDYSRACIDFENRGGQRIGTLLIYLNDDFTEGETHFPNFGDKKLKADPGSAIFFRPLGQDDARCHPLAIHAGLPVGSGVKYVCNAWIREGNFK
jgi:prolyl 4-hydroxylase